MSLSSGTSRFAAAALIIGAGLITAQCAREEQKQETTAPAEQAARPARDPEAMAALERMGAYLRTLQAFEVRTSTTLEQSIGDGQKIEFGGQALFRVRRPNAFYIETSTDRAVRRFYYDGANFTVYAPRQDFYATIVAPPTIRETVDQIYDSAGIALPLADLFYWSDANAPSDDVRSAMHIGYAKIDGVDTDQYAYRGEHTDWQVWIQRGAQPLPRRIVIITADDEARPEYTANLTWNLSPRFVASDFAFRPPADARPIVIASMVAEETQQ